MPEKNTDNTMQYNALCSEITPQIALVVFGECGALWWLKGLRPGFRHCFVCLEKGEDWIVVNPLCHYTEVKTIGTADPQTLKSFFTDHGMDSIFAPIIAPTRITAPFSPFTCVEAVKRILGIHDRWVLTPWQLFQRLSHSRHATPVNDQPADVMRSINSA